MPGTGWAFARGVAERFPKTFCPIPPHRKFAEFIAFMDVCWLADVGLARTV
jgi:hypothetical protein